MDEAEPLADALAQGARACDLVVTSGGEGLRLAAQTFTRDIALLSCCAS